MLNLLRLIAAILLLPVYAFSSIVLFFRETFGAYSKPEYISALLDESIRLTIVENLGSRLTPFPRISYATARAYASVKDPSIARGWGIPEGANIDEYDDSNADTLSFETTVDGKPYIVFIFRAELIANHTAGILLQVKSEEEHRASFSPEMRKVLFKDELSILD